MVFDHQSIADFKIPSTEEWLDRATRELRGRSYETLIWKLENEIDIDPVYFEDDKKEVSPISSGSGNDWKTAELFDLDSLGEMANEAIHHSLNGGLEALFITGADNPKALEEALEGVHLDMVDCFVYVDKYSKELPDGVIPLRAWKSGIPHKTAHIEYHLRPGTALDDASRLLYELTTAIEGLNKANTNSLIERLQIRIDTNDHYLSQVAFIRSMKLLLKYFLDHYEGVTTFPKFVVNVCHDHSVSPFNQWVSATAKTLAGVVGGVDYIISMPVDEIEGTAADTERRISRNIQHLLKMESHMDVVEDPAAGSYFMEEATEKICAHCWNAFLERLKAGGHE